MLKHILIAATYAMLAVAVSVVLPGAVSGVTPLLGWIAGGLVFIFGAIAHEAYTRADQGVAISYALQSAHKEIESLHALIKGLGKEVGGLADGGESEAKIELDRVVAEVRVLQNLIGQLSASGSASAAFKPANPEEKLAPAPDRKKDGRGFSGLNDTEVLDIVRDGLRNERVDLYLQPIVSLPQRKTRFYECFSRIRAEDGTVILPDQYIDVAKREGLVGAIDNMLLFRCVQLVRKAQSQNHNVSFFCNISADTLEDRAFFSDFMEFLAANRDLGRNLLFEFSQADMESHSEELESYATRLGRLGFSFSLDRVEDLEKLDLAMLARLHIRYIKIDSQHLVEFPAQGGKPTDGPDGKAASAGVVDAGDEAKTAKDTEVPESETVVGINVAMLKHAMDVHGIDLIVEKLETEQDLIELLDYRIDFGQGYLFGEPRLSKVG